MATSKFNSNSKEEKRMSTKELLFKLAGNDSVKQYRADLWSVLIPGPITEAQGKLLLSYDIPDHYADSGIKRILNMAVSLVEPVYLRTVLVEYAGEGEGNDFPNKSIATALSLITVEGRRTVLKSTENLHSFVIAIEEAIWDRNMVPPYALMPTETVTMPYVVDNIYKAAWCIVEAIDLEDRAIDYCIDGYGYTCNEQYSLKKIKAILKAPERIDRYAQIEYKEYDYSVGYLLKAKELIESLNIPEFKPIWFKTSEDIAAEGAIMNNCIAGYWNQHGISRVVFACIYKGRRLDIEIGEKDNAFTVYQCFEKSNQTTEIADELIVKLDQAIANYYITTLPIQDHALKVCVFHDGAVRLLETGEIVIDDAKWHPTSVHQIHGIHPITGTAIAYKAVYTQYENAKFTVVIKDITGTEEVCPWPEDKHDTDDDILDDDFDDVEFEPQFEDDLFDELD